MTSPGPFLYRLTQHPREDVTGLLPGQARISLHVKGDTKDVDPYLDLCDRVTKYFDSKLDIFRVSYYDSDTIDDGCQQTSPCGNDVIPSYPVKGDYPAYSVVVFLRFFDPDGHQPGGGSTSARGEAKAFALRDTLAEQPWKLHHKEHLKHSHQGKISLLNTDHHHEFFYTSSHLPLWGLRHVHYGREHVRFVLYTSRNLWSDQVQFYTLLLGLEPELLRDDFCLFTVQSGSDTDDEFGFDVQLSLKRLPEGKRPCVLNQFHLQVKVRDIGQLVPLFPNICRPLNDVIWQTTDHDGNFVFLDVVRTRCSPVNSPTACSRVNGDQVAIDVQHRDADDDNNTRCDDDDDDDDDDDQHFPVTCVVSTRFDHRDKSTMSPALSSVAPEENLTDILSEDGDDKKSPNDIDLCSIQPSVFLFPPSSQPRGGCTPDGDEESLTLTNTSEESGIQLFHDEGTCCDNEGGRVDIRSCLSKARSKIRSTNRRVRFSDEIEAFEDDSVSRLSSGFESDDQSDVEIGETRFPAIGAPSDSYGIESSRFSPATNCYGIDSSRFSPSGMTCSQQEQSNTKRLIDDKIIGFRRNSGENNSSNREFNSSKAAVGERSMPSHGQPLVGAKGYAFQSDASLHNSNSSTEERGPLASDNEFPIKRKPPSYDIATKRIAELSSKAKPVSSPFPTLVSFHKSIPFDNSNATTTTSSPLSHSLQQRQQQPQRQQQQRHFTNSTSHPPTPSSHSQESANQSVSNGDAHNSLRDRNYAKTHHHNLSSNAKRNRTDSPHPSSSIFHLTSPDFRLQDTDNGLNFNLRFDTCPTSNGKPRKEQIGFFV